MSRCFPYPPVGYEANKSRNEGLIDSFELQRERNNAKERKRNKKDKKERKEKKKDKSKENGKLVDKSSQLIQEAANDRKRKYEVEQLDRSNITEEHGKPVGTEEFCDSSDSTQSSIKRRKLNIVTEAGHRQGNGLRIRLPLLKRNDPEPPSCEERASAPRRVEEPARLAETSIKYNAFNCSILEMEARIQDLLDKWKPLELQIENPDHEENLEWLFERRRPCKQGAKNYQARGNSVFKNCGLRPCEVYALPYAVPF